MMREFDLVSIDWDSVRLMQAGQFSHETYYLEELQRWTLQRGRVAGVLHLADDGIARPSPEGNQMFSVSVRGCFAVADNGHIIDIPDDRSLAIEGMIEARTATVPLYVGVSVVERASEPELYPSVSTGLLQCGGRRRQYLLATDNSDDGYDWAQVAQFVKTASGLAIDQEYIPECMFMSSHALQWEMQEQVQALAKESLDALEKNSSEAIQVFTTAAALAGSIGPAARLVNGKIHPRAYVDRLTGIFVSQQTQLRALPKINLAIYTETLNQLRDTLAYLDGGDWTMGQALVMARECFERILKLYPPLLKELGKIAAPMERVSVGHETVVAAPTPPQSQGLARNGQPPASQEVAPAQPKKTFWRG